MPRIGHHVPSTLADVPLAISMQRPEETRHSFRESEACLKLAPKGLGRVTK